MAPKYILRSGGAAGADSAFEYGCDSVSGGKEIYLPWLLYNGHPGSLYPIPKTAFDMVDHLWPGITKPSIRQFFARNCQQVFGEKLDDPVDFVICWTPGGKVTGGTGKTIQLAVTTEIPVYNLATDIDKLCWDHNLHYNSSISQFSKW